LVATCDAEMRCIRSGGLAIDGDTLVAVGPSEEVRERFRGRHELDMSGFLVMPGLINTHTHAAMTCFRGLGCDLPLHQWLHRVIFPAEAANVSSDLVYHGTLLAAVEMLQNGVTTFCDGYFFEESAARAVLESGIRAILGQGLLDFPTPDNADPERARDRAEAFLGAFPTGKSRLRPSLFCHSIYTCSTKTLQWVKALCREHDILFQIHLSETASEVQDCIAQNGVRPAQFLDRYGILDESTLCAHAVWLEQDEIDLLARRRVGVSHNVESNMKLASGVAPIPELLAAGVKVGLGTDGCASNNDLDLFSEMDRAAKLHKVFHKDPTACPAHAALWMAAPGGAQSLGWQDAIGSLEVGKKADVIAIDLNQPHLTPLYDPVSHLVYAAKGSDVRHVWVDGVQVVANGRILTVDVEELAREINRLAEGIRKSVPEC
jgi:5-methylthioadenosine/S-adenosylhomocysteine deaminase